jgi:hypothetical protein
MCEICDGKTWTEVLQGMGKRIAEHGWSLEGVAPGKHTEEWLYSVGFIENYDSPELVVAGEQTQFGGGLLCEIGDRITSGLRVKAGDRLDLDGFVVELDTVHASYLAHGLLASWERYYDWLGERPGPLRALQVIPPSVGYCSFHEHRPGCLTVPGTPGFGHLLNRAARRARARRAGRSH